MENEIENLLKLIEEEDLRKELWLSDQNTKISFKSADFNMFELITSEYREDVIQICRTIRGREYNPETKSWFFPINSYTSLVKEILGLSNIDIDKVLSENEIHKIQVVIVEELEDIFVLRTPYNQEINNMLKNFNVTFSREKYGWQIEANLKADLIKRFESLDIEIKHLADKPKGNKLIFFFLDYH